MEGLMFRMVPGDTPGKLMFQVLDAQDEILLVGGGSFDDREAGLAVIRAVIELLSDATAYQIRADLNGPVLALMTPDGRQLASGRSESDEAARLLRDRLVEAASEQEEYPVALPATTAIHSRIAPLFLNTVRVDSSARYDFTWLSNSGMAGFELFQNARDGRYYFHFNDVQGVALLFSRGFSTVSQRNERLRRVAQAAGQKQRYERREEGGQHFFLLKARNGQEIARSRLFASSGEMEKALIWLVQQMPLYAEPYEHDAANRKRATSHDLLERLSQSIIAGFELLRDAADRRHYFLFRADDGAPLLFSQGYKSRASRDESIKTLIRLGSNPARYEMVEEQGRHAFRIRASNRQEIARSRDFDSAAAAVAAMSVAQARLPAWANAYGLRQEDLETAEVEQLVLYVDRAELPQSSAASGDAPLLEMAVESMVAPVAVDGGVAASSTTVDEPEESRSDTRSPVLAAAGHADIQRTDDRTKRATGTSSVRFGLLYGGLSICVLAMICLFWLLRPHPQGARREERGNTTGIVTNRSSRLSSPPAASMLSRQAALRATSLSAAGSVSRPGFSSSAMLVPPANARQLHGNPATPPASTEAVLAEYLRRPEEATPRAFTMDRLAYPPNSHEMNAAGKAEIHALAHVLLAYPKVKIAIRGHIDGKEREHYTGPNPRHGYPLSKLRADCLMQRLHYLGVPWTRMEIEGDGDASPVASDATEEGRQRNRRLEIIVVARR